MLVVSRSASGKGNAAWGVLNQALAAAKELPLPTSREGGDPRTRGMFDEGASRSAGRARDGRIRRD